MQVPAAGVTGVRREHVCWCEHRADEYLCVFPHHARFHVSNDDVISYLLHVKSSKQMLRQLLLNQIIPRYLASTGRLVLHASAAMMAIIYCAFSLDPSDRQIILHKFRNIGRAISERLGVYRLRYPRVHDRLPEVRAALIMPTRP